MTSAVLDRGPLIKPLSTTLSQTSTDAQTAATVWGEFTKARSDRLHLDYEWYVAWQWYKGDTSVFYDRGGGIGAGQIYRIRNRQKRAKRNLPLNLIGHSIDLLVAKQMRARPTFDAAPGASLDENDRLAARAARKLVRFLWDKNELTAERRMLLLHRNTTGNGFIKTYFDPNWTPFRDNMVRCATCNGTGQMPQHPMMQFLAQQAGQQVPPPAPCPICTGVGQTKQGRKALGDCRIAVVPPYEVWPLAGGLKVEDGIFHGYRMTKEAAALRFHLDPKDLQASSYMGDGKNNFAQMSSESMIADRESERNDVWLVEKWQPPAPGTEQPRLTLVVGNKLVWPAPGTPVQPAVMGAPPPVDPKADGQPAYNRVPFFQFRLRPSAENFWSSGIVLDMISANDFVNRTRASFHRNQQTMAYPKWFVEEGGIDKDALVAEEGEVVTYRSAEPPIQRSPATMPDFYIRLYEQEMDHIPRLCGLQEIDTGKAPPNVEAYQALHFLAEQSETVHGPVYLEDERQWRQIAKAALICAVNEYQPADQRIVRVGGQASLLEVNALLAADLSDSVEIRCEIGSALAHSPALRQAQVMDMIQAGVLTPDEAKQKGLLDFGIVNGEDIDDHEAQESVAAQENEGIISTKSAQGHIVLQTVHDHAVHIIVHRRAALEAQMRGDIQTAQALEMACEAHAAALAPPAPPPGASGGGGTAGPNGPNQPTAQSTPFDSQTVTSQYEQGGGG